MTEQTGHAAETPTVTQAEIEARIAEAHRLRAQTLAAGGRSLVAWLRSPFAAARAPRRRTA